MYRMSETKETTIINKIFDYSYIASMQALRDIIEICRKQSHVQEVAFSIWHSSLTQTCFGCNFVRSNLHVDMEWDMKEMDWNVKKPNTYNGTCEGCGMGFIRCTFELCPDCKSRIIPDQEEED